jgi:hypothetical protein
MKHATHRLTALVFALVSVGAHAQSSPQYEYRALKKGLVVLTTPSAPGTTYLAQASATKLTFGAVEVGQSDTRQVLLSNVGTGTLTLSVPTVSGSGFTSSTACGSTLAAGASCLVDVTFSPTQAGSASGSLNLVSNAQGSPIVVSLSGNAVQAEGSLVAATSANFGSVQVGGSASRQFTFTNTGTSAATGVRAVLNPASGLSFTANTCGTQASPVTVEAGQSCSMTVSWVPSSNGVLSASLSVESSAANSPSTLALTGTVLAPTDPLFASVSLLMPLDTNFNSVVGNPVTQVGGSLTSISTGDKVAGAGAGLFGAEVGNSASGRNFIQTTTLPATVTVELWVKPALSGASTIMSFNCGGSTTAGMHIWRNGSGSLVVDNGASAAGSAVGGSLPLNQWRHVAVTRDGTTTRTYIDGTLAATGTFSYACTVDRVFVGSLAIEGSPYPSKYQGLMDDIRVTHNAVRYSSNFTPPMTPHPVSGQ